MEIIRGHFTRQLREVQEDLVNMTQAAKKMLQMAIESLQERDVAKAKEVISLDDIVDSYNYKIEEKCLRMIALQQPVAKDLRVIAAVMKIITDVERIGDYSIDIAKLPSEILERVDVHYNQSIEVCRALVETNIVEQHAIYSSLRLVYLLEEELLTEEQALLALDMACSAPLAVDEAIFRLGWKKRTRLRED